MYECISREGERGLGRRVRVCVAYRRNPLGRRASRKISIFLLFWTFNKRITLAPFKRSHF